MKNLGKYIITAIIIAVTMALSSCIQYYPCEATGEYFAGNITDKEVAIWFFMPWLDEEMFIVHSLSNNFSCDTIDYIDGPYGDGSYGYGKNGTVIKYEISPKSTVMPLLSYTYIPYEPLVECKYQEPYFGKYVIFNLTDTTSVSQRGTLGRNRDGRIDRFVEVLYEYDEKKDDEVHWTYKLMVTDSLLSLMEKDTSMLSLFPEYYGNSR